MLKSLALRVTVVLLLVSLATLLVMLLAAWDSDRAIPDEPPLALVITPQFLTFSELGQAATLRVEGLYSGRKVRPLPDSVKLSLGF